MVIETICAWCKADMGETSIADDSALRAHARPVSHGICNDCLDYFTRDDIESLQDFLDSLDAPTLLVDTDGVVMTANSIMQAALGKGLEEVREYRGGEVMECAWARLPGGCGNTTHCAACTIRNTVMATHADGEGREGVEAFQDLLVDDSRARMRVLISTEKVGATVLLRVDDMRPA